jgi:hypothetical protein
MHQSMVATRVIESKDNFLRSLLPEILVPDMDKLILKIPEFPIGINVNTILRVCNWRNAAIKGKIRQIQT